MAGQAATVFTQTVLQAHLLLAFSTEPNAAESHGEVVHGKSKDQESTGMAPPAWKPILPLSKGSKTYSAGPFVTLRGLQILLQDQNLMNRGNHSAKWIKWIWLKMLEPQELDGFLLKQPNLQILQYALFELWETQLVSLEKSQSHRSQVCLIPGLS